MASGLKRSSLYNPARLQHFREEQMQLIKSWKREAEKSENNDVKVHHETPIEELDEHCLTNNNTVEGSMSTASCKAPTLVNEIRAVRESLMRGKLVYDIWHNEQKLLGISEREGQISTKVQDPSPHQNGIHCPNGLPNSASIIAAAQNTASTEGVSNLEDFFKPSSSDMLMAGQCTQLSLDEEQVSRRQTSKEEARDRHEPLERQELKKTKHLADLNIAIVRDRRRITRTERDIHVTRDLKWQGSKMGLNRKGKLVKISHIIRGLQARIKTLEGNIQKRQTKVRALEQQRLGNTTALYKPVPQLQHSGQFNDANVLVSTSDQAKNHDHADRFLEKLAQEWTVEPEVMQELNGKNSRDNEHRNILSSSDELSVIRPRPAADMSRRQFLQAYRDALAHNVAAAEEAEELAGTAAEWVAADAYS